MTAPERPGSEPGFIDMHSHSDWRLWANRRAESKIRQGVTTEAGIEHVLVNGRVVIRDGEHTGNLPGRVLTR